MRLAVSRLGKQVIDVVDVDAGYADTDGAPKQVLTDVTWLIGAGDRYGLWARTAPASLHCLT